MQRFLEKPWFPSGVGIIIYIVISIIPTIIFRPSARPTIFLLFLGLAIGLILSYIIVKYQLTLLAKQQRIVLLEEMLAITNVEEQIRRDISSKQGAVGRVELNLSPNGRGVLRNKLYDELSSWLVYRNYIPYKGNQVVGVDKAEIYRRLINSPDLDIEEQRKE